MTAIHVFDFDGTLAGCSGREVMRSALFLSLLKIPGSFIDTAEFKPREEALLLVEAAFKLPENASMNLSPEAVAFLKKRLQEQDTAVFIISHNKREYIKLALEACGLNQEEIAKIVIQGRQEMPTRLGIGKLRAVKTCMASLCSDFLSRLELLAIYDDERKNCEEMNFAAGEFLEEKHPDLNYEQIGLTIHAKSAQFDWNKIEEKIVDRSTVLPEETHTVLSNKLPPKLTETGKASNAGLYKVSVGGSNARRSAQADVQTVCCCITS